MYIDNFIKLDRENVEDIIALTPMQEGMLFHYLKSPSGDLYFEQLWLEVSGNIEIKYFEQAWGVVVDTNEMLRTVFRWEKMQNPTQVILKKYHPDVRYHDLSGGDNENKSQQVEKIKREDRNERFDLHDVPFRITLIKLEQDRHVVVVSNHHILYDGWSNGIILEEFFLVYSDLCQNKRIKKPVKTKFKEYIRWRQSQEEAGQGEFRNRYLTDFTGPVELSVKRSNRSENGAANRFIMEIGKETREKLDRFIHRHHITLPGLLYSAWGLLLQTYNNTDDVIFGTTVSGRAAEIKGIENIVGLFINTLPLRIRSFPGEKTLDWLLRINHSLQERVPYENTPLVKINEYSPLIPGDRIFDTIVVIENYPLFPAGRNNCAEGGLSIVSHGIFEMTNYDLTVTITLTGKIEINFIYNVELFPGDTIERLGIHYKQLLEGIATNSGSEISCINILPEEEMARVLFEFNRTEEDFPGDKFIQQFFAEQVERIPDHLALVGVNAGEGALTYRELMEKSNRLACLLQQKGVGPGVIVGIMAERSFELIIGILGILKAGGAYLPIDVNYPGERIRYMLADSALEILLAMEPISRYLHFDKEIINLSVLSAGELLSVPEGRFVSLKVSRCYRQLAYVIYTSGSTGTPKGVMVGHCSVVNILTALHREYFLNEPGTYLLKTSVVFDVSVVELFGWFWEGGRLVVLEKEGERDPGKIMEAIEIAGVTQINFVPSMFNVFVQQMNTHNIGKLSGLKYIFLAGEELLPELVQKFRQCNTEILLENIYGPTEVTIYSSRYALVDWDGNGSIPIGKPFRNIKFYILDRNEYPQPVGVPGELCISGTGLARGYLNKPGLTALKFKQKLLWGVQGGGFLEKNPPGRRRQNIIYTSGDLARWLADGNIEFLGRMDQQVKIRGYRIELGEIESQLLRHKNVRQVIVVAREDESERGEAYIVAYVVYEGHSKENASLVGELRAHLSRMLPEFMIPAYFIPIDRVPLTSSGKVDRKALPGPRVLAGTEYVEPVDGVEKKLVELWSEVLGVDRAGIGVTVGFFECGGHSLKAIRLVGRIQKEFNVDIPLPELFNLSTVRGICRYIKRAKKQFYQPIKPIEDREYYPLDSTQKQFFLIRQLNPAEISYNITEIMFMEGRLSRERFAEIFRRLIDRHESLRTSFCIMSGEPVQRIHNGINFEIEFHDLTAGRTRENYELQDTNYKQVAERFIRPFDLARAPLLRVGLLKEGEGKHFLVFDTHHIIMDGVSLGIFINEFMAFYNGDMLPAVLIRYRDYIDWMVQRKREGMGFGVVKQSKAGPAVERLNLPSDNDGPGESIFEGKTFEFALAKEEQGGLRSLARREGTTLYTVLLSIFSVFLAKLCGQENIVVGNPTAGRAHPDLERVIGLFIKTVVLQNFPSGEKCFLDFLTEVKAGVSEVFENRGHQYEELLETVSLTGKVEGKPFFNVMFVLQNMDLPKIQLPGLISKGGLFENRTSKFDLTLICEENEHLKFKWEYSRRKFKEESIGRFCKYFQTIVSRILAAPNKKIGDFEIISNEEKQQILFDFNGDAGGDDVEAKSIHESFRQQVEEIPGHIALLGGGLQVSNSELDKKSDQLAYMLKRKGVKADTIVGIMGERSIELIAGLLGILKAGGAYLPIDPEYPEERIEYMIADSSARILVTSVSLEEKAKKSRKNLETIFIDSLREFSFSSSHLLNFSTSHLSSLAYVIYTSGTTGNPKGVMVAHKNVLPLVNNPGYIHFSSRDRLMATGAVAFDISTFEIWAPLLNGLMLILPSREILLNAVTLGEVLVRHEISILHLIPPLFNQLAAQSLDIFGGLSYLLVGGDVVQPGFVNKLRERHAHLNILHMYGPTENTTFSTSFLVGRHYESNIPIGKPIGKSFLHISDRHGHFQPVGVVGELCVGGVGLARGYLNNPELTFERFTNYTKTAKTVPGKINTPNQTLLRGVQGGGFLEKSPPGRRRQKQYKTGDLGRWLADGNVEFMGRIDHQVKIRGFRIELREIENRLLTHPLVKEAVVIARSGQNREKFLCAYVVPHKSSSSSSVSTFSIKLRSFLFGKLPEYMIPSFFVRLSRLPVTSSGKTDRRSLPEPELVTASNYIPPRSEVEKKLVEIWSEVLAGSAGVSPGIDDKFFEIGGNSLTIISLCRRLFQVFGKEIPVVDLFRYTSIREQAKLLSGAEEKGGESRYGHLCSLFSGLTAAMDIAVIGMAGRFPGALDIDEFRDNLDKGIEAISFFTDRELEEAGISAELLLDPHYIKARGFLGDAECFDAAFFDYSPGQAALMDPQVRLLHQCCWEALEDAGYVPDTFQGLIGLFAGASPNIPWIMSNIRGSMSPSEQYELLNLNGPSFVTLVSYKLNLKGPVISVQTACSTSLAAVDTACRSLLSGACHLALSGGVSISFPNFSGYLYQEGMIMSPDGHCRAFDARATGTMTGSGSGIVVLKPLPRALADNDHIYGVIKSSAANNDGLRKPGYTAPSVEGQAEVIGRALADAGIEAETIGYIESHGTGTPLGDPVEIESLKLAFNTDRRQYCALGSLKPNIGHLDAASGIAGLIKALLVLKYKRIPPVINFESPNPAIDLENSPFYINTSLTQWKAGDYPRRAGVSSFGIGGTNAHVILEEAPEPVKTAGHSYQLILLSAKTEDALDRAAKNLLGYFKKNPGINLADAAYTLQQGRKAFKHRWMSVCRDVGEAVELWGNSNQGCVFTSTAHLEDRHVVFMFPGQGAQYVNMGLELYKQEPVFREELHRCFEILKSLIDTDIKEILYPSVMPIGTNKPNISAVNRTEVAQPVLFSFEYALAKLLMTWGIYPAAMIGHSIGEYTAAHLSGVMSLEDTLKLVVLRGRLMQQAPSGSMLSVPLPEHKILAMLNAHNRLSLAAVNSSNHSVVSGPHWAVDTFEKKLAAQGLETRKLHTSHAFHSDMMEPILTPFEKEVRRVSRQEPQIPYISNVTGNWFSGRDVANPWYWSGQLRQTVRFSEGLSRLFQKDRHFLFLELGPGKTLTTFVRQHRDKGDNHVALNLVRHPGEKIPDLFLLVTRLGQMWLQGKQVDWSGFQGTRQWRRLSLPTYPFERQCFISDSNRIMAAAKEITAQKKPDTADWFYIPVWKRQPLAAPQPLERLEPVNYLIFADTNPNENVAEEKYSIITQLLRRLKQAPGTSEVIVVTPGTGFAKENRRSYRIAPGLPGDYECLFKELAKQNRFPNRIIHLWTIAGPNNPASDASAVNMEQVEAGFDPGFYSLLYTARAIGKQHLSSPVDLTIVTPRMQDVTGEERPNPRLALVLGAVTVIPQEFPNVYCRCIDIEFPLVHSQEEQVEKLLKQLLKEIDHKNPGITDSRVAFRRGHRWVHRFESLRLEKGIEERPLLRRGGVYLVTGGLGTIGRILTEYLAVQLKSRVILTGRTALPPKEQWTRWLSENGPHSPLGGKIRFLQRLEAQGAEVLVHTADAADEAQMDAVIRQTIRQFGRINGVFHAANISIGESVRAIRDITRSNCQDQFYPKIKGVLVLERVLRKLEPKPDFCLLMSSLAAVLGGLGFVAYSAANTFMDMYTRLRNQGDDIDITWISVNWDAWQPESAGFNRNSAQPGAALNELALSPEQGISVLERILSWGAPGQIILSTAHPQDRVDGLNKCRPGKSMNREISTGSTRPPLSVPYTPPRHRLDQSIAEIWEAFFGFKPLGIYDDFYELGGDSLKAVTLAYKIQAALKTEVPLTVLLETPSIEGVASYIANNDSGPSLSPIVPQEKKEYYRLSSAQKRLFFLDRFENIGTSYHIPVEFKLSGPVDKNRMENTFLALIHRHDALRTSFHLPGDEPVQQIHDRVEFKIDYVDSTAGKTDNTKKNHFLSITSRHFIRPFNLSRAPLLRIGMKKISTGEHLLRLDMHHIISDGISTQVLMDDFLAIYSGTELPELQLQYKDFAAWQNHLFAAGQMKTQADYWLNRFKDADEVPVLNLAGDFPRPTVFSFKGDTYSFKLDYREISRFKKLSTAKEVTLFMNILAVFNVLLFKYTDQSDIIVGSSIAGRQQENLQRLMGLFVNILALRSFPLPGKTYLEFLKEVKKSCTQAFENQDMQFELLVDQLNLNRNVSRNPLFDVSLVNLNFEQPKRELHDLTILPIEDNEIINNKIAKFDLTLSVLETDEDTRFYLEYYTGIFTRETIERMAEHFKNIIKQVSEYPTIRLADIDILSNEEKHRLLFDLNDTSVPYPFDKTIHQLFEEQTGHTPNHIALVSQHPSCGHLSYLELNEKANQLAQYLISNSIRPGCIVGIMTIRSPEMIIGLLGILKAGAAYVPIEPEYPEERIKYMLADSSAKILVTSASLEKKAKDMKMNTKIISIDCLDFSDFLSSHLLNFSSSHLSSPAYIIYTSGSTGKPKGVMIGHKSIVNTLCWRKHEYNFDSNEVIMQIPSFSFDSSVEDIFTPLVSGSKLVLLEHRERFNLQYLKDVITKHEITHFLITPYLYSSLLNEIYKKPIKLKSVTIAGDNFTPELVKTHFEKLPGVKLVNEYGPTENSVCSTVYTFKTSCTNVLIGKPIRNVKCCILNKSGMLSPIGVPGELAVAGKGLARGYLNNPGLTSERFRLRRPGGSFVKPPPGPPQNFLLEGVCSRFSRVFLTGDLVRGLLDLNIQFLGRIDQQVKIRGVRIELKEIEGLLLKHPAVKDVVALVKENMIREKVLCSYVVSYDDGSLLPGGDLLSSELREFLLRFLPDFMVPSYFVFLEKIPLTNNGKLDRNALPDPETAKHKELNYNPPRNYRERKLVEIWTRILSPGNTTLSEEHNQPHEKKPGIGIDDNFFQLGGHSLKAAILVSRIYKAFNIKVPLNEIFSRQTIRELAQYIAETGKTKYTDIEPIEKREYYPLSSAQKRLYFLQQMDLESTAYNIPAVFSLGKDTEISKLDTVIKKLIVRHESLRTSFIMLKNHPVQKIHSPKQTNYKTENASTPQPNKKFLPGGPGGTVFTKRVPPGRRRQEKTKTFVRPFDLARGPLIRSEIIEHPGGYTWLVDMHHIISDGTSSVILWEDLTTMYRGKVLPGLRVQYKDFSNWQNRLFSGNEIRDQEKYWLDLYGDTAGIPRLDLPVDFKRPAVFTFVGDYYYFVLAGDDTRRFKALGSRNNATLYMNILLVLNILFYKYTGQTDIIIGTGAAGRPHADLQHIIGMFVNTLAMRNYPGGEKTYETFLEEVIANSVNALQNQDVQFEELVDRLDLERDASRNPLFDILMVVQNFRQSGERDWDHRKHSTSRFDMTFFLQEAGEEIDILIEYYADIFKRETIIRLADHFRNIIKVVVSNPGIRLQDIDILTDLEREEILYRFNRTGTDYPADRTIAELFSMQVQYTPHHTAVVMGNRYLTYRCLEQQADRLAGYLFYETGIGPDQPVGVLLDRSPGMITAVVGIIKAGGAYVPLSVSYPEERLKRMLLDIDIRVIIGGKRYIKTLNRLQWECRNLETFLCLDSEDVNAEKEPEENKLMSRQLWEYVGQTSVDEVTGGGWNSSYTGEPIPGEEMEEYGDNILLKLEPLLHKDMRVLEIGTASGITMYRLAPRVGFYYGTDLSNVIVAKNQELVKQEKYTNIKLRTLAAHEISKLEEKDFDLVILNSVVQCFNGHNYLRSVLSSVMNLMSNQGCLFIGDIMDQDMKEALIGDLVKFKQQDKTKKYKTKIDWSEELFISRQFIEDLAREFPWICAVEFSEKIYTLENELTKFRYDALIHIDKTGKTPQTGKSKHKHQHDRRNLRKYKGTHELPIRPEPGNLAYIIYTSGSTGIPKGVMAQHGNVVRLVKETNFITFNKSTRLLQTGALEFDASTFEIWGILLNGLTLHLEEKNDLLVPAELKEIIGKNKITMMWMTASYFNLMLEADIEIFAGLEYLLIGGETLSAPHVNRLIHAFPALHVINGYGPTENVTFSTTFLIDRKFKESIPIGKPIANSTAYIIDRDWNLLPGGAAGELCVGGAGLARGYLNDVSLTREKFIANPFEKRQRLYRTGDYARWKPDGNIEFLGRLDTQVKIRGFRIELAEIENRLLSNVSIKQAAVIDREDDVGSKQLAAYVVSGDTFDPAELRDMLSKELPEYMIPAFFIPIEKIPLTPNGKIDRQALPKPGIKIKQGYLAPGNETEKRIVETWSKVLGIDKENISMDANFFHLGGHSLKATVLTSRLHKEFNVKVPLAEIFTRQTPGELAQYIENACVEQFSSLQNIGEKEYYTLSSAQKRIYILQQMAVDSTAYNISAVLAVKGSNGNEHFQKTAAKLIKRHESLRTSFHTIAGEPVQRVHRENYLLDFTNYKDRNKKGDSPPGHIIKRFIRPFDLSTAPLLRMGLKDLNENENILMLDMHHIISDGSSLALFIKEFSALYTGAELPTLRFRYKDYSQWQNRSLESGEFQNQETFWKNQFEPGIPVLNLPVDFARPSPRSYAGSSVAIEITPEENRELKQLAADRGVTLYMVLLALFNIFLSKLSGQEDIVIGTPIAGRSHADLRHIIGMFVNTLALRNSFSPGKTFNDFLIEIKKRTINAFANQDYPFETLVKQLAVTRDLTRNPLFDVMFEMQNMDIPEINLPGLTLSPYSFEIGSSQFDLTFSAVERENRLQLSFKYCTHLFKEDSIKRFSAYFKKIASSAAANPNRTIAEIEIIAVEEKRKILLEFNDTNAPYAMNKTIPERFEEQAGMSPDYIALHGPRAGKIHEEMQVTYGQLNADSLQLALFLQEKGVKTDSIVGIMVDRTIEMMTGIYGILKAHGAYLPIDPGYPEKRIDFMMRDSSAKVLLTAKDILVSAAEFNNRPQNTTYSYLQHLTPAPSTSLAYVIYTSGTTGQPKGTAIAHHSLVNRLCWMQKKYPLSQRDTILHKTPFTFDVSVWEIFWWSIAGAKVCLLSPGGEKNPAAIIQALVKHGVTVLHFVPSMLSVFLEYYQQIKNRQKLTRLEQVFASGEALITSQVSKFKDILYDAYSIRLANLYGPTEATIDVSYFNCFEDNYVDVIPIGKPIDNIKLFVLDKYFHLQPQGIAGELSITGAGLARGYLNKPELTIEKFLNYKSQITNEGMYNQKLLWGVQGGGFLEKSPPGRRRHVIYKTGDLARWLTDGNIEFLGRLDQLVKIRGFRIEMAEIEDRLLSYHLIKDAVVTAGNNQTDNQALYAYIVSHEKPGVTELKEYLSKWLPDYMVPQFFIQVEQIPLTPNGKLDRKALAASGSRLKPGTKYTPPTTPIEIKITGIWREILQLKEINISIHDNFFDLGGTSMDVIRVNAQLTREFGHEIPLVTLYKYTSIRALSRVLEHGETPRQELYQGNKRTQRIEKGRSDKSKMQQLRRKARLEK